MPDYSRDLRDFFSRLKLKALSDPELKKQKDLYEGIFMMSEEISKINERIKKLEQNQTTS